MSLQWTRLEDGTLHEIPDKRLMGIHFHPGLIHDICDHIGDGGSIRSACRTYGVSLSKFHRWRKRFPFVLKFLRIAFQERSYLFRTRAVDAALAGASSQIIERLNKKADFNYDKRYFFRHQLPALSVKSEPLVNPCDWTYAPQKV